MNVLFINPAVGPKNQHPLINSLVFSSPPLGMASVVQYIRQKNALAVEVIDEVVEPQTEEELRLKILSYQGELVVGISCLTATIPRALNIARLIKNIRPETHVVFGGVHVTVMPEESLLTGVVDVVVRNEGELTMSELCTLWAKRKSIDHVDGISRLLNGKIVHNPNRKEIISLSEFESFPFDLFDKNADLYSSFSTVITSRGCPFDCIFCSNRVITGKRYRTYSDEYVLNTIETLVRVYKQNLVTIIDDNIIVNKNRFQRITQGIIDRGLNKEAAFVCQFRAEDISESIINRLHEANFIFVSSGFEASSNRLLKIIKKNETVEEIHHGLDMACRGGLVVTTTFIFGLPTETEADRKHAFKIVGDLNLSSIRYNIAIPYPGTELYNIAEKEGRLNIAPDWQNFNVQYYLYGDDIPYYPSTSRKYSVLFDTMWANMRFFLLPKNLYNAIFKTDRIGGAISIRGRSRWKSLLTVTALGFFIFRRFIYLYIRKNLEKINSRS